MTTEKIVCATTVRLATNVVVDASGQFGNVWDAKRVQDLVVFPDSRNARCRIGGRVRVAVYVSYDPNEESQEAWERSTDYPCPVCGQQFASSQGRANHMLQKHGRKGM